MILKPISVGEMGANCYIVGCPETKEAMVIDPGGDAPKILSVIEKEGLSLKYIVNTHGHIDHVMADQDVKQLTGAQIVIHEKEAPMLDNPQTNLSFFVGRKITVGPADRLLTDGDTVEVGKLSFEVLHTPGHTTGGICLYGEGVVFSGDTLFASSIGRTDFPGGSYDQIIASIKEKLFNLPEETKVYPGHMGYSTIAQEKKFNPFFR